MKKGRCHRCCKELDAYPRFLSLEDPFLLIESVCMHFGSRSSSSDGSDCEVVQICQATIIKEASMLTKIIKVAKHVDGGLVGD